MLSALFALSGLKKQWPQLSEEEVRRHNTRNSLWIVSGNSVYDVTDILYSHPGGDLALLRRGGGTRDCVRDFNFHSCYARRQWAMRKVGEWLPSSSDDDNGYSSSSTGCSYDDVDTEAKEGKDGCERSGGSLDPTRTRQHQKGSHAAYREKHAATVKAGRSACGALDQSMHDARSLCMCPKCGRLTQY